MDMTVIGTPIMGAVFEQGITPNLPVPMPEQDEWMRRLGTLPLMYQPGERWQYQISSDLLGVLVSRVAGQSFEAFLRERIFEPLGMKDTGFWVPGDQIDRLPRCMHRTRRRVSSTCGTRPRAAVTAVHRRSRAVAAG
jgi:CubicO group peptidase (beta-lactamase class C family)